MAPGAGTRHTQGPVEVSLFDVANYLFLLCRHKLQLVIIIKFCTHSVRSTLCRDALTERQLMVLVQYRTKNSGS